MDKDLFFPEIRNYIEFWFLEERELFQQLKVECRSNSLVEQLNLISTILSKTSEASNILLFILGKILYNLSLTDILEEKLVEYDNNNYLNLWQGFSISRKGEYETAETIFKTLLDNQDHLISLASKIGIARIKDRRGEKKDAISEFIQIREEIETFLESERKSVFLDLYLNCVYGELWSARTERNVEDSKNNCMEILSTAKDYGDRVHIAKFNALLGILEKYSGNWNQSKNYFELAGTHFKELGDRGGEVSAISNLADVERMQGNFESAEKRLLSVIPLYEKWNDNRSIALVHSNLGEIYAQKRLITTSIKEFILAKEILDEIGAKDELVDYSLAELYLEQKEMIEFNQILGGILEGKTTEEIEQNPHILYFFGKKEILNLNMSKGKNYLNQALNVSVKRRMDHLSAKILIDLIQVILFNYLSNPKEEDLNLCAKLLDDLKVFTIEKQPDTTLKPILLDVDKNCKTIFKTSNIQQKRRLILETQKIIKELVDLIRYNVPLVADTTTITPNQLIILHRSGIPLKRFLRDEKIVDDILLFGGMVRAAKDIISEIFSGEIGRVMKIDYGEDIVILAEFGHKETGTVMITRKDTFHQRRALHETVKELNKIEYPAKFHGEMNDKMEQEIDEIIFRWFGEGYIGEK
ncbi:MAG: tetratricopeptide repeat protein [Candidatus Heimdallarchaeota archaeon]|nr:tetratricopeptide repeat protein [Candidatus Heimdallarchaeota archaeon]